MNASCCKETWQEKTSAPTLQFDNVRKTIPSIDRLFLNLPLAQRLRRGQSASRLGYSLPGPGRTDRRPVHDRVSGTGVQYSLTGKSCHISPDVLSTLGLMKGVLLTAYANDGAVAGYSVRPSRRRPPSRWCGRSRAADQRL